MFLISFQIYDKFVHRFTIDFLTREFLQSKSDTTIPLQEQDAFQQAKER